MLLELLNRTYFLQRESYVIQPVQQAMPPERIRRECDCRLPVRSSHLLLLEINL